MELRLRKAALQACLSHATISQLESGKISTLHPNLCRKLFLYLFQNHDKFLQACYLDAFFV